MRAESYTEAAKGPVINDGKGGYKMGKLRV